MQSAEPRVLVVAPDVRRYLVLTGVLLAGLALLLLVGTPRPPTSARWPSDPATFRVNGWSASAPTVESAWGTTYVTREYQRADGTRASFIISASPQAKIVYSKGADLAFLGNGYSSHAAEGALQPSVAGEQALVLRRESERLYLVYQYGERRGLLGNGPLAWALAAADQVLGHENDYYLLRVIAPLPGDDAATVAAAQQLAAALFPRVAAWYGS